ncbi:MAG: hypothetical protein KAT68_14410 [Bacteroidales bacterium]|nr:hypothetical protein [Bacteroidales bacterium]
MNRLYIILTFILIITFPEYSLSQSCKYFYKINCAHDENSLYKIHEKSINKKSVTGQVTQIEMEIFYGRDYKIIICGDEVFGNIFDFKIKDIENNIMYDNANDNYSSSFEFSALESKNIIIEVVVPDTNEGYKAKGCLGILIEYKLSVKTGF